MGQRKIIENGTRFGKLLVVADAGSIDGESRSWVVCDCGSRVKKVRNSHLHSGNTTSCGCLKGGGRIYRSDRFFMHLSNADKKNEQWKSYNDTYEISNMGHCRNKTTGKILNPQLASNDTPYSKGYLQYNLNKNGGLKYAHRLVAEVWMDDFTDNLQVDHISGDTFDNRLSNIQQLTTRQNVRKARARAVVAFAPDGELRYEFDAAVDAKEFGFMCSAISRCCNGLLKTYKGLVWKFKDQVDASEVN